MVDLKTTKLVRLGFFPQICVTSIFISYQLLKMKKEKAREKYTKINIK